MGAPAGNNYAGRAKDFRFIIRRVFAALDAGTAGETEFNLVEQYVIEAMKDKDVRKDLFDRLYGKPHQSVSADGGQDADGNAIPLTAQIVLVRPGG